MNEVGIVLEELQKRDEILLQEEQEKRFEQAQYNKRYKSIRINEVPIYLQKSGHKGSQSIDHCSVSIRQRGVGK